MSEDSLIGDAKSTTDEVKDAAATEVSHLEQQKPSEPKPQDTQAWITGISKTLYAQDGKPNFDVLPEKYWKDGVPNIQDALAARSELEKKFSRGDHKAPTEYDISFATTAGVAENDPLLGSFKSWAKDNGISQDAFTKLASNYIELQKQNAQQIQINIDQEKQKLGPNADKVISEMVNWGQTMVKKGIWSNDDFEEFKIMGGTARGLNALAKVREYYGDMQRIPTSVAESGDRMSRSELDQMIADPRYTKDPAFRAKVEKAFAEMYADS